MTKPSPVKRCAGLLVLSLSLAGWAAAHGLKNWTAPVAARKLKNPVPATEASLAAAKAIYLDDCAQCHGEAGKGDGSEAPMYAVKPADFTDAHMMEEMTDGEIFWKIGEGRRPMPASKKSPPPKLRSGAIPIGSTPQLGNGTQATMVHVAA